MFCVGAGDYDSSDFWGCTDCHEEEARDGEVGASNFIERS